MTQDGDITQKTLQEMTRVLQEDRLTAGWQWVKGRLQQAMSGMELVKGDMADAKASAPHSVVIEGMAQAESLWLQLDQQLDRMVDSIPV